MSAQLNDIVEYLNALLKINTVQDYCPNGLQVEGRSSVVKIIGGVTASQALIDAAISKKADAILVHHGYFWKGEEQALTGIKRQRIASLLQHDISLIAYHLPLDMHPELGNNVQLAKQLGLTVTGPLDPNARQSVGITTELPVVMSASAFNAHLSSTLGRQALHIGQEDKMIKRIGLCTGAAQSMIEQAVALNLDAFISGEISEPTFHIAQETGISYFSAGHHATERGGVKALGLHLENHFDITFEFVDILNPV
jgi:dinuclear metal center YbgI/SA1388 family protein